MFLFKLAGPAGTLVFSYLAQYWAVFDETLDIQSASTVTRLRLILLIAPLAPCSIAALLALCYPPADTQCRRLDARKPPPRRFAAHVGGWTQGSRLRDEESIVSPEDTGVNQLGPREQGQRKSFDESPLHVG
jgi:hypothetical protein